MSSEGDEADEQKEKSESARLRLIVSPNVLGTDVGERMGTSAIRQGNPLHFAQSLVWRMTFMSIEQDDVLSMPEGERYIRYCIAVREHRAAGLSFGKVDNERIASLFNVTPATLQEDARSDAPREPPFSAVKRPQRY